MKVFFFCLLNLFSTSIIAQTCCSGGVPVSNSLGLPDGSKNTLQMALNYDYNRLNTLKQGSENLGADVRRRVTNAAILQLGYNATERIGFETFYSFVDQERKTLNTNNGVAASGLGDLVLLAKYKLINDVDGGNFLNIGAGGKLPTGSTVETSQGFPLIADLQPGSGAVDGIFWTRYGKQLAKRPSAVVSAGATYSAKGKNDDYLNAFTYQFGNELQATIGYSDQFVIGGNLIDPSLTLRYRNASQDKQNQFEIPNTGGNWLFIEPAVLFWASKNIGITLNGNVPVYANVDGTQLSPTFRINSGVFFNINLKKSSDSIKK